MINNDGFYKNVCVELDIDALAVNTLLQSQVYFGCYGGWKLDLRTLTFIELFFRILDRPDISYTGHFIDRTFHRQDI